MSLINASTDTLPILLRDPTKSRQFFHVPRPHTPILWYTILKRKQAMQQIPYTYWTTPDGWYVGYWNDYPDHSTQGHDLQELEFMLRDLRTFIDEGVFNETPRQTGVMEFA